MKAATKYLAILVLILSTYSIKAQSETPEEERPKVIIELVSGSIFEGVITKWVNDEYLKIKTDWGNNILVPMETVEKIIQKNSLAIASMNHYRFKETGIYYTGRLQFIAGNEGSRARAVNGLGIAFSSGYRFNRMASVGLGIGYDRFIWNSGENFVPLFAEFTSYFFPSNTSLYTNIQAGYSLAFEDEQNLLTNAKGGIMFYPALGLRLGKGESKFTIDLGYKFQKAELTYRDAWSTTRSEQRLIYRRLSLRIGILI